MQNRYAGDIGDFGKLGLLNKTPTPDNSGAAGTHNSGITIYHAQNVTILLIFG